MEEDHGHATSSHTVLTWKKQPAFVYELLNIAPDADGLNDRQLVDFPPEREMLLDELVPMPLNTPDLQEIFLKIVDNHQEMQVYSLEGDAYCAYRETHDELVEDKLKSTNENAQGILSKARGYCTRIAMVIHSLELALELLNSQTSSPLSSPEPSGWDTSISTQAVKAASTIIHHFSNQKFIMLGLADDCSDTSMSPFA